MGIIDPISSRFYQKELLNNQYVSSRQRPLKEVSSLIYLLAEEYEDWSPEIDKWAHERFPTLELVNGVIITNNKEKLSDQESPFVLGKKDFDWKSTLKNPIAHSWMRKPFDMLINFSGEHEPRSLYLAAVIPAELKIGFSANPWKVYDVLLENGDMTIPERWERLSELLTKINADL